MELPDRIVFYDGVCAFCNRAVRWLVDRDEHALLHYAPLQGETARRLQEAHPERFPSDVDTVVYAEREDGELRLWLRAQAALRLLEVLDVAPLLRALLRVVPRPVADLGYRLFAVSRYRLFGRFDTCPVPPPALRPRFLP